MRVQGVVRGLITAVVLVLTVVTPAAAAAQQEFAMNVQVATTDGAPMEMKLWAGVGPMRMDMNGDMGQMSMVWSDGSMLMINHAQRSYMEFTREMMERMQQMMGQMGQNNAEEPEFDPTAWTFERTGATDTINGMSAFEVKMTGPDGKSGALWMTNDTDTGLFEAFARLGETFQSMGMPGMRNPMQRLRDYAFYARAQGLPEGRVIRVVDGETGTVITVNGVEMGPFAADTWGAPAGYAKQQMPMMPR